MKEDELVMKERGRTHRESGAISSSCAFISSGRRLVMRSPAIIMMTGGPFMTIPRSFMKEGDAVTTSSGIVMTSPRPLLIVSRPLYASEPGLKP